MDVLSQIVRDLSKHKYKAEYDAVKKNFKMVKIKTPSPRKQNAKRTLKQKLENHLKSMEAQSLKNIAPGGRWYISPK